VEAFLSPADSVLSVEDAIENVTDVAHPVAIQGPKRGPVYRPVLSLAVKERIGASGRTVEELIEAGLQAMRGDEE
jgi:hypothetical protein